MRGLRHGVAARLALLALALSLALQTLAPSLSARMIAERLAAARLGPAAGSIICGHTRLQGGRPPTGPVRDDCGSTCPICVASAELAVLGAAPTLAPPHAIPATAAPRPASPSLLAAVSPRPRARAPPADA